MNSERTGFVVFGKDTKDTIAREVGKGRGRILIADIEDEAGGEFSMDLFDRPTIDLERMTLQVKRGEKMVGDVPHQTGWENDRQYRLRPKRERSRKEPSEKDRQLRRLYGQPENLEKLYEEAASFFEHLPVGDAYEFGIHMQARIGRGVNDKNSLVLYVQREMTMRAALTHALTWMLITKSNKRKPPAGWPKPFQFTDEHVAHMVAYALADLKTGDVLRHNVETGAAADAFVGIG